MTADDTDGPAVFTGPGLADHIGVTYRQLDHWARSGYLKPTILDNGRSGRSAGAPGTGRRRVFMGPEVVKAENMAALVRMGILPRNAARVAIALADGGGTAVFGRFTVTVTPKPDADPVG